MFGILTLFVITDTAILDAIGITINAFRIAGGLLLFVTAFEMIYGRRQQRRKETTSAAVLRSSFMFIIGLCKPASR